MPEGAVIDRGCVLVTGASGAIGAAAARLLAAEGWAVGVHYCAGREPAELLVEEIRRGGGRAAALGADFADPAGSGELCARVERELERPLLVLVNNAATRPSRLLRQLDDETWAKALETNLSAAYRLTRRALRSMLRERFGRIVNVASLAAEQPAPGQGAYAASKAGLVGFTKAVAVEVATRSITVNAVAPGLVDTPMVAGTPHELLASIPAGRLGTPEEVAACIGFLASEQAGYVTGTVLTVDGGLSV